MTLSQMQNRLRKLERTVEHLVHDLGKTRRKPIGSWRRTLGRFGDDPVFEEIVRLGRQYRQSLRPKSQNKSGNGRHVRH
jgi:hypothetical protein